MTVENLESYLHQLRGSPPLNQDQMKEAARQLLRGRNLLQDEIKDSEILIKNQRLYLQEDWGPEILQRIAKEDVLREYGLEENDCGEIAVDQIKKLLENRTDPENLRAAKFAKKFKVFLKEEYPSFNLEVSEGYYRDSADDVYNKGFINYLNEKALNKRIAAIYDLKIDSEDDVVLSDLKIMPDDICLYSSGKEKAGAKYNKFFKEFVLYYNSLPVSTPPLPKLSDFNDPRLWSDKFKQGVLSGFFNVKSQEIKKEREEALFYPRTREILHIDEMEKFAGKFTSNDKNDARLCIGQVLKESLLESIKKSPSLETLGNAELALRDIARFWFGDYKNSTPYFTSCLNKFNEKDSTDWNLYNKDERGLKFEEIILKESREAIRNKFAENLPRTLEEIEELIKSDDKETSEVFKAYKRFLSNKVREVGLLSKGEDLLQRHLKWKSNELKSLFEERSDLNDNGLNKMWESLTKEFANHAFPDIDLSENSPDLKALDLANKFSIAKGSILATLKKEVAVSERRLGEEMYEMRVAIIYQEVLTGKPDNDGVPEATNISGVAEQIRQKIKDKDKEYAGYSIDGDGHVKLGEAEVSDSSDYDEFLLEKINNLHGNAVTAMSRLFKGSQLRKAEELGRLSIGLQAIVRGKGALEVKEGLKAAEDKLLGPAAITIQNAFRAYLAKKRTAAQDLAAKAAERALAKAAAEEAEAKKKEAEKLAEKEARAKQAEAEINKKVKEALVEIDKVGWPKRRTKSTFLSENYDLDDKGEAKDYIQQYGAYDPSLAHDKLAKRKTRENRLLTEISGSTANLNENQLKNLAALDPSPSSITDRSDSLIESQSGFVVAQYHGTEGFRNLERHVNALRANFNKDGDVGQGKAYFAFAAVNAIDGQVDPVIKDSVQYSLIVANGDGVSQIFVDKSAVAKFEQEAKNYFDTNKEDMVKKALQLLGANDLNETDSDYQVKSAEKLNQAIKLARTWSRDHVMSEMQKTVVKASETAIAQKGNDIDYANMRRKLQTYGLLGASKDNPGKVNARGRFFDSYKSRTTHFDEAVGRLQKVNTPVGDNDFKGVSFSKNVVGDVVKISFTSTLTDIAYPYIEGTPNCRFRVQVAKEDGQLVDYWKDGLLQSKKCKKGDIVMDENTVWHLDERGSYRPLVVERTVTSFMPFAKNPPSLESKFPYDASKIKKGYWSMTIQAVSDIDGQRAMAIQHKDFAVRKRLSPKIVRDDKGDMLQFVRGLGDGKTAGTWSPDPQEIFTEMPALRQGFENDKAIADGNNSIAKDSVAFADELRKYRVKICLAKEAGLVTLNDGSIIKVKAGEWYKHPLPVSADNKTVEPFANKEAFEKKFGAKYVRHFEYAKLTPKIIDKRKNVELQLRQLIEDGDVEKVKDFLKEKEELFKSGELNINAVDSFSRKSALHLACEKVAMWKKNDAAGASKFELDNDCIVKKLLDLGADASLRCAVVNKNVSKKTGLTAAGIARKAGLALDFIQFLDGQEKGDREKRVNEWRGKFVDVEAVVRSVGGIISDASRNISGAKLSSVKGDLKDSVERLSEAVKSFDNRIKKAKERLDLAQKKLDKGGSVPKEKALKAKAKAEAEVDRALNKLQFAIKAGGQEVARKSTKSVNEAEGVLRGISAKGGVPSSSPQPKAAEAVIGLARTVAGAAMAA